LNIENNLKYNFLIINNLKMKQSNKEFYYLDGNEQKGPLKIDQLELLGLKPDTLVWAEGMEDWEPAKKIEELEILIKKTQPPAPPTPSSKQSNTEKAVLDTSPKRKSQASWIIETKKGLLLVGVVSLVAFCAGFFLDGWLLVSCQSSHNG
jgi:hypothetical protein